VQTVVKQENETEKHLDALLKGQFETLAQNLNYEMTMIGQRVHALEKEKPSKFSNDHWVSQDEF
jgi:hypothetical protein